MPVKKTDEPTEQDVWADDTEMPAKWAPTDKGWDGNDRDMITISLKGGSGTQAWIVGHFNSVEEAVDVFNNPEWEELIKLTVERGNELQEAYGGSSKPAARASAGRSGGSWGSKSKPAEKSYSRSSGPQYKDEYDCDHGERDWVAKGTWQAWMCPSDDKDDKCDPLWANKDGSLQTKRR